MPTLANNPTEVRPCLKCGKELKFELVDWGKGPQWSTPSRAGSIDGIPDEVCTDCIPHFQYLNTQRQEFGPLFDTLVWETFKVNDGNSVAFNACRGFTPTVDNLYLWGPCGVGKTHLLAAIIHEYPDAKFVASVELARQFRKLNPDEERFKLQGFRNMPLLAIDDVGVGRATEFSNQILYEIVENRIRYGNNGLIITTNYSPESLAEKMGDDRLASRLAGLCRVVELKGEDWRLKKGN